MFSGRPWMVTHGTLGYWHSCLQRWRRQLDCFARTLCSGGKERRVELLLRLLDGLFGVSNPISVDICSLQLSSDRGLSLVKPEVKVCPVVKQIEWLSSLYEALVDERGSQGA
jgi:hypothetical protein